MSTAIDRMGDLGLVPVVKIDDADNALALADALIEGGLPVAEITFRTDAAAAAIGRIADQRPDLLVGAGTVLNVENAARAIDAGAAFLVAPGLNTAVVEYAAARGVAMLPGVCTPSDVEMALGLGLDTVKFFPAEAFGGLATLKAMSAPYAMMRWVPTGGINASNLADYLAFAPVLACGGSWMVAGKLIAAGEFDTIAGLTRDAVAAVRAVGNGREN